MLALLSNASIVYERISEADQVPSKVVEWDPPSHAIAQKIHESYLFADGSHDVQTQIALSGEPLIPPLASAFKSRDPMDIVEYQALTIRGRDYEGMYADYWNHSAGEDGKCIISFIEEEGSSKVTGQLVDAVIMPVAPHSAVIPGKFWHTGIPSRSILQELLQVRVQ